MRNFHRSIRGETLVAATESFGGMIGEKLLGLDRAAGAVAVDAAQIKGVLPLPLSALHSVARSRRVRDPGRSVRRPQPRRRVTCRIPKP